MDTGATATISYGVVVIEPQRYCTLPTHANYVECCETFAKIAHFLNMNKYQIEFGITNAYLDTTPLWTDTTAWIYEDTQSHPEEGDVVKSDDTFYTGYRIKMRAIKPCRVDRAIPPSSLNICLVSPQLEDDLAHGAYDPMIENALFGEEVVHINLAGRDTDGWWNVFHQITRIDTLLIMGNFTRSGSTDRLCDYVDQLKHLFPNMQIRILRDLCIGNDIGEAHLYTASDAMACDAFAEPWSLRGIPMSIQVSMEKGDESLSSIRDVVTHKWRSTLSSHQWLISSMKPTTIPMTNITYGGIPIPLLPSLADGSIGEYISKDQFNKAIDRNRSSLVCHGTSRKEYDMFIRPDCISMMSEVCSIVPPRENPFGADLIPGRGDLPFFGVNFIFVTMKIDIYKDSFEPKFSFVYKTEEIYPSWKRTLPMLQDMDNVVFCGYLPHEKNTKHAWFECAVLSELKRHAETEQKSTRHKINFTTSMERIWIDIIKKSMTVSFFDVRNPLFLLLKHFDEDMSISDNTGTPTGRLSMDHTSGAPIIFKILEDHPHLPYSATTRDVPTTLRKPKVPSLTFDIVFDPDTRNFLRYALHINTWTQLILWLQHAPESGVMLSKVWSTDNLQTVYFHAMSLEVEVALYNKSQEAFKEEHANNYKNNLAALLIALRIPMIDEMLDIKNYAELNNSFRNIVEYVYEDYPLPEKFVLTDSYAFFQSIVPENILVHTTNAKELELDGIIIYKENKARPSIMNKALSRCGPLPFHPADFNKMVPIRESQKMAPPMIEGLLMFRGNRDKIKTHVRDTMTRNMDTFLKVMRFRLNYDDKLTLDMWMKQIRNLY